ncbi:MAG: ribosome-binding factor A [Elusimicrobia bacterium]|nr:ribosome-binding factor A [Elusimicrobiota bacterium]
MQREVSLLLGQYRELLQERALGVLLTITGVHVARNLEQATVHYSWTQVSSPMDRPQTALAVQRALESVAPSLVRELRARVKLKRFPRVNFVYDETFESADRIYQILNHIQSERDDVGSVALSVSPKKIKNNEQKKSRFKS